MAVQARLSTRLGPQGRLVIPAALRKELALRQGDELVVTVEDGRLVLERPDDVLRRLRAELRAAYGDRSLVDELIAERRREAALEPG